MSWRRSCSARRRRVVEGLIIEGLVRGGGRGMRAVRRLLVAVGFIYGFLISSSSASAQDQALRMEVEQLRRELAAMKEQYDARLAELEAKLQAAGQTPAAAPAPTPAAP